MAQKIKSVYVKWLDSQGYRYDAWRRVEETNDLKPEIVETRGYILQETDEYITIAASVSNADNALGVVCIPKVAIVKRK